MEKGTHDMKNRASASTEKQRFEKYKRVFKNIPEISRKEKKDIDRDLLDDVKISEIINHPMTSDAYAKALLKTSSDLREWWGEVKDLHHLFKAEIRKSIDFLDGDIESADRRLQEGSIPSAHHRYLLKEVERQRRLLQYSLGLSQYDRLTGNNYESTMITNGTHTKEFYRLYSLIHKCMQARFSFMRNWDAARRDNLAQEKRAISRHYMHHFAWEDRPWNKGVPNPFIGYEKKLEDAREKLHSQLDGVVKKFLKGTRKSTYKLEQQLKHNGKNYHLDPRVHYQRSNKDWYNSFTVYRELKDRPYGRKVGHSFQVLVKVLSTDGSPYANSQGIDNMGAFMDIKDWVIELRISHIMKGRGDLKKYFPLKI